jgi:hypothetical protein
LVAWWLSLLQDLTIAAVSQLSRRKIIYYDRKQWGSVGIPMITVINAVRKKDKHTHIRLKLSGLPQQQLYFRHRELEADRCGP